MVRCRAMSAAAAATADVIAFLDELLEIERFADYGPNGLQVPGGDTVTKVVTGVSAQLPLFERAHQEGAELVLVHHGLFWDFEPTRAITAAQRKRLRVLLANDIALAGYHLPLDGHQQVGNNALLAAGLGATRHEPAFPYKGTPIGVIAHFADSPEQPAPTIGELTARVTALTDRDPLVFDAGPERVRTLGIVSGAAAGTVTDAIALGLDAFMTGEPKEHVMVESRENGIHFIAAGHYATETFGIRRLGELVAERFGVEHLFVDLPNPV
jgi:dinuclear metal center YbgI/SA1388 family protein